MFTIESKSQLAKLLASENLLIEHKSIPTAYFDLKTRTLCCPIWKDMSGELYDLLMGHEVGHALYTPVEGWHDAVCDLGKNFKGFLNVIEDARIEKKMKRKYPGIKRSFVTAYKDLIDRDFFGIKKRDMETIPFIDKVNLFTKTEGLISFDFTSEESSMVERVLSCETWQDVVDAAKEIYEYSKDEQKSILEKYFQEPMSFDDDDETEYNSYDETDLSDDLDDDSNDEQTDSEDADGVEKESEEFGENGKESDSDLDSEFEFEPVCETDEFFRDNEIKLLDEESKEYCYAEITKPRHERIVTPYNIVHKHLSNCFDSRFSTEEINEVYKSFRNKNEKYIALLAKEFEMRKSAKAYMKNKVSDTGEIDINKIFKYRFDDNIFRKITIQPKGKSHGLVLLLDHSGSMYHNMASSIEQILILSMFCKKINIPFVVYGFNDIYRVRKLDFPNQLAKNTFEQQENGLDFKDVFLREYLNSQMSTREFNRCIRNLTMLSEQFLRKTYSIPSSESFGGTPLIEAMVALRDMTRQFKKNCNLDIVNTVIVHDGDADPVQSFREDSERRSFNCSVHNVYIVEKKEKFQMKLESDLHPEYSYDYALKNAIFEWYKKTTDSKIFGFFIVGQGKKAKINITRNYRTVKGESLCESEHRNRYTRTQYNEVKVDELMKNFKEDKFIQSYNKGYDSFYLIPGGKDLSVENEELEVKGNYTKGKLKSAFVKMGKKKQTNRVLVSKFIAGIA
jgi:hypothetical protein